MFALMSTLLVLVGIAILIGSLVVVCRIVHQLPEGRAQKRWCVMAALVVLFIVGYLGYLVLFWQQQVAWIDLIVPGIFFFGACFVWFSSFIALQTTLDVLRISDLEHETLTDPLTGVYNRRFMEQRLSEEVSKARRYGFKLSVLMFDLDHFKRVNDDRGHPAGDRVLVEISALVREQLRDSDILARYGGEEFLIVAPHTGAAEALLLGERLRFGIEAHEFLQDFDSDEGPSLRLTVSVGLASFSETCNSPDALIRDADRNLYTAKNEGRNCARAA